MNNNSYTKNIYIVFINSFDALLTHTGNVRPVCKVWELEFMKIIFYIYKSLYE